MDIDLTGKSAIVTGGSRGIGRAVALTFGRHGAAAVACYINETEAVRQLGEELGRLNGGYVAQVDVTDQASVQRTVDEAAERLGGKVDILVNNAGAVSHKMLT